MKIVSWLAVTHSAVPVTCKQQYDISKQGSWNRLVDAVSAVGPAGAAGDTGALATVLETAKPMVARAARYPMPACAGPKGYNVQMIAQELLADLQRTDG